MSGAYSTRGLLFQYYQNPTHCVGLVQRRHRHDIAEKVQSWCCTAIFYSLTSSQTGAATKWSICWQYQTCHTFPVAIKSCCPSCLM